MYDYLFFLFHLNNFKIFHNQYCSMIETDVNMRGKLTDKVSINDKTGLRPNYIIN